MNEQLKFTKDRLPGLQNSTFFTLFFSTGWQSSRWNRDVIKNMLPEIHCKKTEKQVEGDLSDPIITATIWNYTEKTQNLWQKSNPHITQDGNRLEMAQEAQDWACELSVMESVLEGTARN